jgi:hypothetical protein
VLVELAEETEQEEEAAQSTLNQAKVSFREQAPEVLEILETFLAVVAVEAVAEAQ